MIGSTRNEIGSSSPANAALRESLLKQRAAVLSNLSQQGNQRVTASDMRRGDTIDQSHLGSLNLLPPSPSKEQLSPCNLSWESGMPPGQYMGPMNGQLVMNGQLAIPQVPPPMFMPGNHMLVPHPNPPPPQPPTIITNQTKDERPGFWLEGYHAGWREAHDVSIIVPEDNSEVLTAISKSVAAVDNKVDGLGNDLTRAIEALGHRQTIDRAQTSAQLQQSMHSIEGQVQPIHDKIAQLNRSERDADKAWDEVHRLQTEFGVQQKQHANEIQQLKQLNAQLTEDKRNMAGKLSEITKALNAEQQVSASEKVKVTELSTEVTRFKKDAAKQAELNTKLHAYSTLLQNTLGQQRSLIACLERDVAYSEKQSAIDKQSLEHRSVQIMTMEGSLSQLEHELQNERSSWEVVVDQVGRAGPVVDADWKQVHECYLDMSSTSPRLDSLAPTIDSSYDGTPRYSPRATPPVSARSTLMEVPGSATSTTNATLSYRVTEAESNYW